MMAIDMYRFKNNPRKVLCVPTGTNPADLALPDAVDPEDEPFRRDVDLDASPRPVGSDPAEIHQQIQEHGYAIQSAEIRVGEDPNPRP